MPHHISYLESDANISKSHVRGGDVAVQEDVDSLPHGVRVGHNTKYARSAVQQAYVIGHEIQHTQVMLHYNDITINLMSFAA